MIQWLKKRNLDVVVEYIQALIVVLPVALLVRTFGYGLYQVPSSSMEPTMLVGERFFADKFSVLFQPVQRGDVITFNDPNFEYASSGMKLIVQKYLWGPRNLTKRVIGIPGDHVVGRIENGKPVIYLNGKHLDEPYVNTYPLMPIDPYRDTWRVYDPELALEEQPFYRFDTQQIESAKKWYENHGQEVVKRPDAPVVGERGTDEFDVWLGKGQYWVMGDNRLGSCDSRDWGVLDESLIHGKVIYRLWSVDSRASWWIFDLIHHPFSFWNSVRWNRSFKKL
ncbi:signal peptidase I [Candidatus Babeliales bacterium]|nr:signal peptidase I [Candidatus Babeliales bacterium]